jgi:hypothetical protein
VSYASESREAKDRIITIQALLAGSSIAGSDAILLVVADL